MAPRLDHQAGGVGDGGFGGFTLGRGAGMLQKEQHHHDREHHQKPGVTTLPAQFGITHARTPDAENFSGNSEKTIILGRFKKS